MVAGHVDMAFDNIPTVAQQAQAGKVRPLAVTSLERAPLLPDVPPMAEFLPGFEATSWHGLFAPAGTPPEIVDKLSAEVQRILHAAQAQRAAQGMGAKPIGSTPEEFAQFITAERQKWARGDQGSRHQSPSSERHRPAHQRRGGRHDQEEARRAAQPPLVRRARPAGLRPPLAHPADGLRPQDYAGKPVIAIINTWSDINQCHAHFKERVEDVKRGVCQAGGFPVELPAISLSEPFVKPTTMLYRNFLAMETEELLRSHPVDGAVLMGGCDKTTPGLIMGAISMDLPAIFVPAGADAARQLARQGPGLGLGQLEVLGRAPGRHHHHAGLGRHRERHRPLGRHVHDHGHRRDHDRDRRGAWASPCPAPPRSRPPTPAIPGCAPTPGGGSSRWSGRT